MKIKSSRLQGIFSILQLTVVTALIVCFLLITKQINYVKTQDLGFDKDYLLTVGLDGECGKHAEAIKQKLLTYPQILNVSASAGKPMSINSYSSGTLGFNGQAYKFENLNHITTDTSFLSTFNIQLVTGRNFRATDNNVCIINEKFYKYLELESIEGKTIWDSQIVGVIKDFNTTNLRNELGFVKIIYNPDKSNSFSPIGNANFADLNIRILPANYHQTIDFIKSTVKEFDSESKIFPLFYDDIVNRLYWKEEQLAKIIKIFAIMAIILACMGLLGIVEFTSRKRIKEIGIRKVNGAPVAEIMFQLNKNIVTWFVIAFMVAIPLAYNVMQKWLEGFAYKTQISWWVFVLSGIIALGIALLTVSWQSWKAATRNPVEALRYE